MDDEALDKLRTAGKIAAKARDYGATKIAEGVLLLKVVEDIERFIQSNGGTPAFPVNIAINDIAAHYTPAHDDKLRFERGDLVKLDVGVHIDGYIGDTATTVEVGTNQWDNLIKAVQSALRAAVEVTKPKIKLRQIGAAIQRSIEAHDFLSVENLTGHSLEKYNLHAGLSIPNVMDNSTEIVNLGDVIAIEPFATNGTGRVDGKKGGNIFRFVKMRDVKGKDNTRLLQYIHERYSSLPFSERWCYQFDKKAKQHLKKLERSSAIRSYPILRDIGGGMVSQAEHTVIITENGCEVIT